MKTRKLGCEANPNHTSDEGASQAYNIDPGALWPYFPRSLRNSALDAVTEKNTRVLRCRDVTAEQNPCYPRGFQIFGIRDS